MGWYQRRVHGGGKLREPRMMETQSTTIPIGCSCGGEGEFKVNLRGASSKQVEITAERSVRDAIREAFGSDAIGDGLKALVRRCVELDEEDTRNMADVFGDGWKSNVCSHKHDDGQLGLFLTLPAWEEVNLDDSLGHIGLAHGKHRTAPAEIRIVDPNSMLKVNFRTMTQRQFSLHLMPHTTIAEVKESVRTEEGIPEDQQRLIYGGKQLEDDRTVGDYSIPDDAVVHLVLRLRGGMYHPTSGREELFAFALRQEQVTVPCCDSSNVMVSIQRSPTIGDFVQACIRECVQGEESDETGLWGDDDEAAVDAFIAMLDGCIGRSTHGEDADQDPDE